MACAGQFDGVVLVYGRETVRHVLRDHGWLAALRLCPPAEADDDAPHDAAADAAPAGALLVASYERGLSAWPLAPLLRTACGG